MLSHQREDPLGYCLIMVVVQFSCFTGCLLFRVVGGGSFPLEPFFSKLIGHFRGFLLGLVVAATSFSLNVALLLPL